MKQHEMLPSETVPYKSIHIKDSDQHDHKNFIKLMQYLNEYKQNICYEGSGLINTNPPRNYNENDYLEIQK